MTDDFVKQLREKAFRAESCEMLEMAADRIEKLEAALRTVKEWHGYGLPVETTRIIDAALEGKDDVD
jgi:hypothetical protein